MIKLIIFDLDGVLVSTKDIHYVSLNKALSNIDCKYEISLKDHLERYDGLPTSRKLKMLTIDKNLPIDLYEQIIQKMWGIGVPEDLEYFLKNYK